MFWLSKIWTTLLWIEWNCEKLNDKTEGLLYCGKILPKKFAISKNWVYDLDFLNSGNVDEKFINFVVEKEKVLFKIADKFRKVKMW